MIYIFFYSFLISMSRAISEEGSKNILQFLYVTCINKLIIKSMFNTNLLGHIKINNIFFNSS